MLQGVVKRSKNEVNKKKKAKRLSRGVQKKKGKHSEKVHKKGSLNF